MSKVKILQLLPKFKERFFHNFGKEKIPYGRQRRVIKEGVKGADGKIKPLGSIDYFTNATGTLTDQLLMSHFSQQIEVARDYEYGTLAVIGKWDTVKWICIDVDDPWQKEASRDYILPTLQKYGITFMLEPSRDNRHHIWFMCNLSVETAEKFMTQFMLEAQQADFKKRWEIYPLFRRRASIFRIPGGYHFKAGKANGVVWDGIESNDPCFIMESFLSLPVYTEEDILGKLKFIEPEKTINLPAREKKGYVRFKYIPRNLPVPVEGMPEYMNCMASNCQAIRKLVFDAANNEYIETPGIEHHNALLVFSGLARFVDHVTKSSQGSTWLDKMLDFYRSRGVESHGLSYDSSKHPSSGAWKCKTLDDYFGYCEGCPFRYRDGFDNPKQLFFGKQIKKVKVEDVIQASYGE